MRDEAHTAAMLRYETEKKSPALAAVINLFFPGLGDAYAGRGAAGVIAFVVIVIFGVLTLGIVYGLAALIGIYTGITSAQTYNRELARQIMGGNQPVAKPRSIEEMSDDEIRDWALRRRRYNIGAVVLLVLIAALVWVYTSLQW